MAAAATFAWLLAMWPLLGIAGAIWIEARADVGGTATSEAFAGAMVNVCSCDHVTFRTTPVIGELDLERHGLEYIEIDPAGAAVAWTDDPNAVNPYSQASGLFQFIPGTWATTPYANDNIFDPVANANAAGWMWSVGRRNEWVCQ